MKGSSLHRNTDSVALRRLGRLGLKLLLPLGFVAVVSLLLMGVMFFFAYRWQRASVINLQKELAAKAALTIEDYVTGIEAKLVLSAQSLGLMGADPDQQRLVLKRLLEQQMAISELRIVNEDGQEKIKEVPSLLAASARELSNQAQTQKFIRAMAGENYISPIYFARDEPHVTMAVSIRDAQDRIVGVLTAEVSLVFVWDVVSQPGFGQTGYAYAVDAEGQLLVSRRVLALQPQAGVEGLAGVEAAIAGERGVREYVGLRGKRVIGAWRPIERTGWKVIAELPTDEAYAHLRSLLPLLVSQVLVGGVVAAGAGLYVSRRVVTPILKLQQGAQFIGAGRLDYRLEVETGDELADVTRVFNSMTAQLQDLIGGLEQRVAERTADLERRAVQLQVAAEVARDATAILDGEELMRTTVERITERFGFYHAGVFLVDEAREYAILRAASSAGGRRMLARGHRLAVGQVGIVGYVAGTGKPRVALDVGEDAVFFDNPDLPDTRSEMALPLRVRGESIGVLDVQSTEPAAFSDEDVAVLSTMADQVAVALDNVRLLAESQAALEAARRAYGGLSREAWAGLLRVRRGWGYRYDQSGIAPTDGSVAAQRAHATDGGTLPELALPVRVRGHRIGAINAHKPRDAGEWTAEEVALMETLTEQLSLALESARLYQDTQRRAAREQLTREITDKMRRATDMDALMQTAVREMAAIFGTSDTFVQLSVPPELGGDED